MIPDELFARFARGENPGHLLADSHPHLLERVSDTADIASDLWLLYSLTRGARALRVLEIGCNDGTSTLAFLKAASEIGGHVTSIDVSEVPVAEALVDRFGFRDHWTFRQGSSHNVCKALIAEGAEFDLCFVDGGHTEADASEDVADCAQLLVLGGTLLTHDNWYAAADVDWSKPEGERGTPGCIQTALQMITGNVWCGVVFPFGSNLGIFRRRPDLLAEFFKCLAASRAEGLIK